MKCSAFWNHTNIRSGNRIYPCCRFKTSIGQFDGDVGNVLHIPEYKKIREANAKGEFVSPINTNYRGKTVFQLPPNTQGIISLIILKILE